MVVRKILVVANEPDTSDMLVGAFSGHSFQTLEAATVESALFQLALTQPDLVILDLGLPGMDVWGTLLRIRELSSVPVITLATVHDVGTVEASLDFGADDVVTRPFDVRELEARARALLRRAQRLALPAARLNRPLSNAHGSVDGIHGRNA
jgi:two-component system KDP operon response regulator KdpE